MSAQELGLDAIYDLAKSVMLANGCDMANAEALADIISRAELDGSHSHGLFRVPGYVKALRSGKVDGKAKPTIKHITPAVIQVDGHGCFAPLAQSVGLPVLVELQKIFDIRRNERHSLLVHLMPSWNISMSTSNYVFRDPM